MRPTPQKALRVWSPLFGAQSPSAPCLPCGRRACFLGQVDRRPPRIPPVLHLSSVFCAPLPQLQGRRVAVLLDVLPPRLPSVPRLRRPAGLDVRLPGVHG